MAKTIITTTTSISRFLARSYSNIVVFCLSSSFIGKTLMCMFRILWPTWLGWLNVQDTWRRHQTPESIALGELGEEEWEVIRDTEDEKVTNNTVREWAHNNRLSFAIQVALFSPVAVLQELSVFPCGLLWCVQAVYHILGVMVTRDTPPKIRKKSGTEKNKRERRKAKEKQEEWIGKIGNCREKTTSLVHED